MKHCILLLTLLNIIVFACCANSSRQKPVETSVKTDSVQSLKKLPERQSLPATIIGKFDGWQIDTVICIENIDGATRFLIRGTGTADIPQREMFVRQIAVQTDSLRDEIWSYVVLRKMAKGQTFEAEALYLPTAGTVLVYDAVTDTLKKNGDYTDLILISKQDMRLRMIKYNSAIQLVLPAATGKNAGDKRREGDKKTPEGIFTVYAIHDASDWDYDFRDGKGKIKGTYGKYFVRFKEHYHIGIHGTHLPETLGSRATEGCIRLSNENIERIVPMISRSKTLMVVTPGKEDFSENLK